MSLLGKATADQKLRGKINGLETLKGYSAYEIALIYGFEGTEEEWLNSLNGGIITVDKQLYRSGHAADAAVVGGKFKAVYSEISETEDDLKKDIAFQEARVDELVAMRSEGGVYTFNHDASDVEFSIRSNGVSAGIGGRVISKTISPGYANALKINIPDAYRPFDGTVMLYQDNTMRIMLSVTDNDAQVGQLVVVNDTASDLTVTEKYFDGSYALRDVVVSEITDIHVGYDGTTYATAGEAVREQIRDLYNKTDITRLSSVTLPASKWNGENSLYSQVVTIDGITEYSKVDLLPSVEQLAIFFNKNVSFVTENEDGVVTVYAIGDKPTLDYTMQVQITEVFV